jgi:Terminase small subunit
MATPSDYLRAGNEPQPEPKPKRHVSQETRQRMSRAHLSIKQTRFIKEYIASGNGAAAARRAGYSPSSANVTAAQNLAKPSIKSALALEMARHEFKVTPLRVQQRLDEISHEAQASGQYGPAVRAEELLGRSVGMFIDRSIQLSGTVNDSHIAALLELARKRQQEPIDLADDQQEHTRGHDSNSE